MTMLRQVPPGRAGRLWTLRRLRSGQLAAELLERKLLILRAEQQRLRLHHDRTARRWQECWREADQWAARAALLGAAREERLSEPSTGVDVTIGWTTVMGLRYPTETRCRFPAASEFARGPGTAVLVEATRAFTTAVAAAVEHAAAEAALKVVDNDVAATRHRLRAINDRWLPRLQSTLDRIERDLDETERENSFRLRWVAGSAGWRPR
jgi:V/A-type H+-transporting ATPase subunit D